MQFADLVGGDRGTVSGDPRVSGRLSLADGAGTLNILGNLALGVGASYVWGLGDDRDDLVAVSGQLDLRNDWILTLLDRGAPHPGSECVLFTYGTLVGGSFGHYAIDTGAVGHWTFDEGGPRIENDPDGRRILLRGLVAVPEPSMAALLLAVVSSFLAGAIVHHTAQTRLKWARGNPNTKAVVRQLITGFGNRSAGVSPGFFPSGRDARAA